MNRGSSSLSFNVKERDNNNNVNDELGLLINKLNPTSPTFNSANVVSDHHHNIYNKELNNVDSNIYSIDKINNNFQLTLNSNE